MVPTYNGTMIFNNRSVGEKALYFIQKFYYWFFVIGVLSSILLNKNHEQKIPTATFAVNSIKRNVDQYLFQLASLKIPRTELSRHTCYVCVSVLRLDFLLPSKIYKNDALYKYAKDSYQQPV